MELAGKVALISGAGSGSREFHLVVPSVDRGSGTFKT